MRIDIRNVTVDFTNPKLQALRNVDLTIEEGERVAVLGSSGSGKTTLLRLMLGAVRPSSGSARVGGFDPFGPRKEALRLRRLTGCVRQRDDLVTGMTGRANALMATTHEWRIGDWLALLRGRVPRRYSQDLSDLARRHGIESCLPVRIERLSGGQRQRVALVRALITRPHLLLADEPTSGLDPHNAQLVVDGMLAADTRTVVIATHDLEVAKQVGRVVALREGRVVFDGAAPDEEALGQIYGPSEEPVCA